MTYKEHRELKVYERVEEIINLFHRLGCKETGLRILILI